MSSHAHTLGQVFRSELRTAAIGQGIAAVGFAAIAVAIAFSHQVSTPPAPPLVPVELPAIVPAPSNSLPAEKPAEFYLQMVSGLVGDKTADLKVTPTIGEEFRRIDPRIVWKNVDATGWAKVGLNIAASKNYSGSVRMVDAASLPDAVESMRQFVASPDRGPILVSVGGAAGTQPKVGLIKDGNRLLLTDDQFVTWGSLDAMAPIPTSAPMVPALDERKLDSWTAPK